MPTITLDKTVLEQLIGKKLPLEQLKDRISLLGTDLEKIEGNEIVVEVFPNRPDLLSEQGFARALSSFIGVKTGLRHYNVRKSGLKVIVDPSVTMRPYTACALVKNLHFTAEKILELLQVQEKLALTHGRNRKKSAYGLYPADAISFPISYSAKDPAQVYFRPLGFDAVICAKDVPEQHPKGKAYSNLTAGWSKFPFFIDAEGKVLSMLPFINSEEMGKVDTFTKNIFIECSGVDWPNVIVSLNILVTTLAEMGGEIYSLEIAYPDKTIITPELTPKKMKLHLPAVNKLLGLKLSENEAGKYLQQMGYGYEKGVVLIPAYRADILHHVDLIEDIAIAYGYENFQEEIPKVATIGEEDPLEKFERKVREILVGFQLLEVKNYHLMAAVELNEKILLREKLIPLKNAKGEYNHLRNSLFPSLLKNLMENQHHEYPQNIFEIGRTFVLGGDTETGITETEHLAIALCHETADFTEIKQILDALLAALGLEVQVKECSHPSFISGRVGDIMVKGKKMGMIGELHPQVLVNWGLLMPVVGLELNVERIFREIG